MDNNEKHTPGPWYDAQCTKSIRVSHESAAFDRSKRKPQEMKARQSTRKRGIS
jgi:hypothetical protein